MAAEQNPYQVLGLTPSASQPEITHAYRRLLRLHHPDTRRGPETANPAADQELRDILVAYLSSRPLEEDWRQR